MGWSELIDKTLYWLNLREQRKHKQDPEPEVPFSVEGLPESVQWREIHHFERESYKVSGIHPLSNGKTLVCGYNNATRDTVRLHVIDENGGRVEVYNGKEETVGQGCHVTGGWVLPVEKSDGNILFAPDDGGKVGVYGKQGGRYSTRIVDDHIGVGNQLFHISKTSVPVATFPRLAGILSGIVHLGNEWIACDDEHGIMSSSGWFIECKCSELAALDGICYAFLRTGEVRVVSKNGFGRTVGNTLHKARRAWNDGKRIWWTTAPTDGTSSHQVWCMTGKGMLNLGEFPAKAEKEATATLGSLFGSAVCVLSNGNVEVAVTDSTQNGWVLYRGIPKYPEPKPEPKPEPQPEPQPEPEPEPQPEPEPEPQPEPQPEPKPEPKPASEDFTPPARTGKNLWTGNGAFNSCKDMGRASESSAKYVEVSGWFKATSWSGGGSAQPKGFCFASKGVIGSHWGINLSVRPNGLVWNATKGEVVASASIALNTWYHVKAEVTGSTLKLWLNGKLLKNGEKTFSGSYIADSGEPLRIGGYYCPWSQATWFNQSLIGQIELDGSTFKVIMK